jgi:TPR repeat protein
VGTAAGHLASMYAYGKGVAQDDTIARSYYESAVTLGDAESGHVLAQWLAAGRGGPADIARAFELNMAAAMRGVPIAMFAVGVHFQSGDGVPEVDYGEALLWFRRAAERGVVPAASNAGNMYLLGVGVHKDLVQAAQFFKMGADEGNEECKQQYTDTMALIKSTGSKS